MALSDEMDIMRQMFTAACDVVDGGRQETVVITELDDQARLREIEVYLRNGNWISMSPDQGHKCICRDAVSGEDNRSSDGRDGMMSPLLAHGQGGYNKACDRVIIFCDRLTLIVVYIEMKSGNPDPRVYKPQFQSTRQFVRYVVGLLREFHGIQFLLEPSNEHFVVVHLGKPNKNRTRPCEEPIPTDALSPVKYPVKKSKDRIFLDKILGIHL